ncbi:MAG: group 1 truncated hemoglobin [Oligoflexales bacterium]|nr:group 1 truncated hemoglobin [Oligoflexales bacterium]
MANLFDKFGEILISKIIARFYDLAFDDPIIGHFFFGLSKEQLIQKQIIFASVMLGSPSHQYLGDSLHKIHAPLKIRLPHFGRRQKIMEQVLTEFQIADELKEDWLKLELKLKRQVVS